MLEQEEIKVMFDSNAFDKLLKVKSIDCFRSGKIHLFITNIQIKELASIPDTEKNKRIDLFMTVCTLCPTIVATTFSYSNLTYSHLRYGAGEIESIIRKESGNNEKDALIADAAVREGCILVTNDKEIIRKMCKIGKDVMSFEDFETQYMK